MRPATIAAKLEPTTTAFPPLALIVAGAVGVVTPVWLEAEVITPDAEVLATGASVVGACGCPSLI